MPRAKVVVPPLGHPRVAPGVLAPLQALALGAEPDAGVLESLIESLQGHAAGNALKALTSGVRPQRQGL